LGPEATIFNTGGKTGVCRGPVPAFPFGAVVVVEVPVVVDVVEVEVVEVDVVDVDVVDVEVVEVDVPDVVVVVGEGTGTGGGSGPPDGGAGGVMPTAGSRVMGVARSVLSDRVTMVVRVPDALEEMSTVTGTAPSAEPAVTGAAVEVHWRSEFADE
jgi:hypothetical protein